MPRKPYRDPKTGRFARCPPRKAPYRDSSGRFAKRPPPKKRPAPIRDPVTGRFVGKSQHHGWTDFTFKRDPFGIEALPEVARELFETKLYRYRDKPALIVAHLFVVEEGTITEELGWKTLTATQKLEASVNNLEWEVEALTLNVNYRQDYAVDAITFRIEI